MEVAKLAGVSFKTVARVVNGEGGVRPEKQEAVRRAMKLLGYVPNLMARQLAGQRSFLLGFVLRASPQLRTSHAYVAAALEGALIRCRELGYSLVVEEIPEGSAEEVARRLHALRVAGVVLPPPLSRDPQTMAAFAAQGTPFVLISPHEQVRAPSVRMDDRKAGMAMTQHLLDLGHRRIGFIGASAWPAAARRREGFLAALDSAGIARDPRLEADGDFTFRTGEAGAARLLNQPEPPTAIFAANDDMALGAAFCASRQGIAVPSQLSIAGFDDSPAAHVVWPPLTTVRQPVAEMAAAAVDLLTGQTGGPEELELDFEVIERASTAPPRRD